MRGFYVTVIRGKRIGWLAGPFACEACARAHVDKARQIACALDPWCDFDLFGVSSREGFRPGILNGQLTRALTTLTTAAVSLAAAALLPILFFL